MIVVGIIGKYILEKETEEETLCAAAVSSSMYANAEREKKSGSSTTDVHVTTVCE